MPSDQAGERLHPLTLVVGLPLVQVVRGLVLPAFAVVAGGGGGDRTPLLLLAVALVVGAARVATWLRFRWSFDGTALTVEQGVLARSRRVVDVARIQQVELDRPSVQRLLGVATLRVETAGSDRGPEVELRVLRLADAHALRAALQARAGLAAAGAADGPRPSPPDAPASSTPGSDAPALDAPDPAAPALEERVVLAVPLRRVALAAVTGAQLLIAPALVPAALQLTGDRTDELLATLADRLAPLWADGPLAGPGGLAAAAVAVVLVAIVTAVVAGVVRDGGFTLVRVGDDLVVRRGLVGTREATVPLRRVQVVRLAANPLRRALGVTTLRIHSAGGSAGGGSGGERRVVVPLVADADVATLLAELLPDGGRPAGGPPLHAHPPAARRRIVWRRLRTVGGWTLPALTVWTVLVTSAERRAALPLPAAVADVLEAAAAAGAVGVAVPAAAVVAGMLLQLPLGRWEHATLASGHDGHLLAVRTGTLGRTLSVAPLARLQGVTRRASWFQTRRGLATVLAHVAGPGGDVVVPDVAVDVADGLHADLASAAAGTRAPAAPLTSPAGS